MSRRSLAIVRSSLKSFALFYRLRSRNSSKCHRPKGLDVGLQAFEAGETTHRSLGISFVG